MGDVKNIHAIKISLEQVVALERQVRVRESKLGDDQPHRLLVLRGVAYAELSKNLLYLRIIGIGGAQLKRVGLLEQKEVLDAHPRFARVIQPRLQLGSRIVRIRARHPWRQR